MVLIQFHVGDQTITVINIINTSFNQERLNSLIWYLHPINT